VLVSDVQSRDIKMDQFTLSFHGRLLIEGAEISLNYGNRYGLLGENGSGKVSLIIDAQIVSANDLSSRHSSNPSLNVI
jgi:ATPase subunit of ABC transporter with duplicated ATPase domains